MMARGTRAVSLRGTSCPPRWPGTTGSSAGPAAAGTTSAASWGGSSHPPVHKAPPLMGWVLSTPSWVGSSQTPPPGVGPHAAPPPIAPPHSDGVLVPGRPRPRVWGMRPSGGGSSCPPSSSRASCTTPTPSAGGSSAPRLSSAGWTSSRWGSHSFTQTQFKQSQPDFISCIICITLAKSKFDPHQKHSIL